MIMNIPNPGMNYLNYVTSIQQKHHVELLGWPASIPFANPHHITVVAVARLLQHALTVATCKWVVMSTRRVKEHSAALALAMDGGETVSKKRKQRSDKGKKRKRTGNEHEEEGEKDDDGDDDEHNVPPPTKKRQHKKANAQSKAACAAKRAQCIAYTLPPTAPKSKPFVDTEDDKSS